MSDTRIPINKWSEDDRPREKLLLKGRTSLSDAELIAVLIGSGNKKESAVELSKRILSSYNNELNTLGKLSVKELMQFKGVGEAKAISIIAALEIGRRRKAEEKVDKLVIQSSKSAYNVVSDVLEDLNHEEFWLILLSRSNKVLGRKLIGKGGISGTVADIKIIFKEALLGHSSAIIVAHNHPSGNLKPSQADIQLTKKIKESGELLTIPLLDHIIVGDKSYYSFADEGIL